MMTIRQSALVSLVLSGLVVALLAGCSAGNPNMSAAESAMEENNYERALANVDSAITQDSANVDAYMMKARILRQMADSTVSPERYEELYREARKAEDEAIRFDSGKRSEIEEQRKLAYIQQYQKGAKQFNRASKSRKEEDYLRAAAYFGAAGAIRPDSTGPILNKAYAQLNAARQGPESEVADKMSNVIPILERYINKDEEPDKNAYKILAQLYAQNEQHDKAVEITEKAIEDLSNRSTYFQVSGSRGLKYSGTIEEEGESRSVSGTVPDRIAVSSDTGRVSGSFQKSQAKGRLSVSLFTQGTELASDRIRSNADTASISHNLTGAEPLAELRNLRLNSLNRAGQTARALELYRNQVERDPDNSTYRYNYGSLLLNQNKYDEAAEQLKRAVELDPRDPKKQYNLGAAYLNKGVELQDSLVTLRDSMDAMLDQNRQFTKEQKTQLQEIDQKRRKLFRQAIPPLERARQLGERGGEYRQDACRALFQAYVQTEQQEKAEEVNECAGDMGGGGEGNGGGGD